MIFFDHANSGLSSLFKRLQYEFRQLFPNPNGANSTTFGKYLHEFVGSSEAGLIESFKVLVAGGSEAELNNLNAITVYDFFSKLDKALTHSKSKKMKSGRTSNH